MATRVRRHAHHRRRRRQQRAARHRAAAAAAATTTTTPPTITKAIDTIQGTGPSPAPITAATSPSSAAE
eukprot:6194386-Pleurochrysis_carterae.AAC.1